MPKHHRQCSFCSNNTVSNPEVVIFCANDNMKCLLNVPKESDSYICEQHFDSSDLKPHSNTKKLRDGALPVVFPQQEAVWLDHNYVQTAPLDMVGKVSIHI